ncbi:hypothetical protein C8R44DRAFT_725220 [Mycena epipterygia]|nr:hypothetical protein C8R44DRAFT_725220 [Mycena epipterygia]
MALCLLQLPHWFSILEVEASPPRTLGCLPDAFKGQKNSTLQHRLEWQGTVQTRGCRAMYGKSAIHVPAAGWIHGESSQWAPHVVACVKVKLELNRWARRTSSEVRASMLCDLSPLRLRQYNGLESGIAGFLLASALV